MRNQVSQLHLEPVYQYKVNSHLEGIENCMAIVDDIIIYGFKENGTNHDRTVKKVQDKANSVGMRFNLTKCQLRRTQVKFLELLLNREGFVSDPAKIDVLKSLPEPRDEKPLQNFLRIVNYLSRFDPHIADMTHNLRLLLKKKTLISYGPMYIHWISGRS